MAGQDKRIIELPAGDSILDSDFFPVDNNLTEGNSDAGSRKFQVKSGVRSVIERILTQDEYNELPSTKNTDGIIYYVTDTHKIYLNGAVYGSGGGGGGGNVNDVYVNGVSKLDANGIAQIKSYKEVTQAQYDALPDSKLTDGILYCITDSDGEPITNKIPYLKSSGTQYIDTGIKADEDTSIICDFFIDIDQLDKTSSWQTVFAGNDGNTVNSLQFSFNPSSSTITYQDGSAYGDIGSKFVSPMDIHRASIVKGVTSFDEIVYQIWTVSTFTSSHNIYLFAGNVNGTVEGKASVCLVRCRIYDENTLIADFVPANNNGVACLYDRVSKEYYTNDGTGSFVYGERAVEMVSYGQVKATGYTELTGLLEAGETSLTLTDDSITTDSIFDYYTSIFGVNPTDATVTTGSITLTFDVQESDMSVKVRVS